MIKPLLVFDMDGVLVDVTESYRETIARTVGHFTGARPSNEQIQELKNSGSWNEAIGNSPITWCARLELRPHSTTLEVDSKGLLSGRRSERPNAARAVGLQSPGQPRV